MVAGVCLRQTTFRLRRTSCQLLYVKKQKTPLQEFFIWLRESDSNRRPQGYGPCELPTALSRDKISKK